MGEGQRDGKREKKKEKERERKREREFSVCAQLDVATLYRCGIVAASPLQNGTAIRLSTEGKFFIPAPPEDSDDEEEERVREPMVVSFEFLVVTLASQIRCVCYRLP